MKTILSTFIVLAVFTACKKDRSCSCKVASTNVITFYNKDGSVQSTSESSGEYMDYRTLKEVRPGQLKDDGNCKSRIVQYEDNSFFIRQDSLGNSYRQNTHHLVTENHSCEIK